MSVRRRRHTALVTRAEFRPFDPAHTAHSRLVRVLTAVVCSTSRFESTSRRGSRSHVCSATAVTDDIALRYINNSVELALASPDAHTMAGACLCAAGLLNKLKADAVVAVLAQGMADRIGSEPD